MISEQQENYYRKHLEQVKGGEIVGIIVSDEGDEEPYCGFLVRLPNKKYYQVVALRDPEGNGPGHLDIFNVPKTTVG